MVSHVKLKHLESSMEKLSKSLNDMIDMFSSAATAMHVDEKEEKALTPVMRRLDTLIDQNQKIASGILAVADMFREEVPKIQDALHRLEFSAPKQVPKMQRPEMHMPRPMPRHAAPHMPRPAPGPAPRPMPSAAPQMEKPPMPPGLSDFEKPPAPEKKKKSGMFEGLFSK